MIKRLQTLQPGTTLGSEESGAAGIFEPYGRPGSHLCVLSYTAHLSSRDAVMSAGPSASGGPGQPCASSGEAMSVSPGLRSTGEGPTLSQKDANEHH